MKSFRNHYGRFQNKSKDEDFIDLSLANNILCSDLMKNKIEEVRKKVQFSDNSIRYGTFNGNPEFKETLLTFLSKYTFKCPRDALKADDLIIASGSMTLLETLSWYLYQFNTPGKQGKSKEKATPPPGIAVPSPYYLGFGFFFEQKWPTKLVPVPKILKNLEYKIDLEGMQKAVERPDVGSVLICNPNNPCGTIYSKEELQALIDMCVAAKKHLIADEVWSLSRLLDKDTGKPYPFTSVYNIVANEPDQKKKAEMEKYVHVIYSLSKDFGLAGWRCGFLYTANEAIREMVENYAFAGVGCCRDLQFFMNEVFKDDSFLSGWVTEMQKRIDVRVRKTWEIFEKQTGVEFVKSKAALFVWFHFPRIDTWEKETDFYNHLVEDKKVGLEIGSWYGTAQPGWFRIALATTDFPTLEEALARIFEGIKEFHVVSCGEAKNMKVKVEIKIDGQTLLCYDEKNLSECQKVLERMMIKKK